MGGLNHVDEQVCSGQVRPSVFYRLSRKPQTSVSNNRNN